MLSKFGSQVSNLSSGSRYKTRSTSSVPRTSLNGSCALPVSKVNNNKRVSHLSNLSISAPPDFDLAASLQDRIDELEKSNRRLLERIEVLSSSLNQLKKHGCQCSLPIQVPVVPHTVKPASLAFRRIFIFADSMGRDISGHLRTLLGSKSHTRVFSYIKPGAPFKVIADSIPKMCPDLSQDDVVFVMGGTNDISELDPGSPSSKFLNLNSLGHLSTKTSIILSTIPYRFDNLGHQSTNIFHTNCGILFQSERNNFLTFDCNKVLHRQHFTEHGLHLNHAGKKLLALKLFRFLSSTSFNNFELRDSNPVTRKSFFSVLPNSDCDSPSRGSNPRVNNNVPDVLSVSLNSTFSSSQQAITVSDIVNISQVNDDLLQNITLPSDDTDDVICIQSCDNSNTSKSKKPKTKNVLPKVSSFRHLSSPSDSGYRVLTPSPRTTSSSASKIPALVPSSRPAPAPRQPNFRKETSKLGT